MDGLTCDGCQVGLLLDSDVRYILRVEGFAAYDPLEITRQDLERDLEAEMRKLLGQLERQSADEARDDVHRSMSFDLCPGCWKRFIRDPLGALRSAASGGGEPGGDAHAPESQERLPGERERPDDQSDDDRSDDDSRPPNKG